MADFDSFSVQCISDQSGSGDRYQGERSVNVSGGVALPSTEWGGIIVADVDFDYGYWFEVAGFGAFSPTSYSSHLPANPGEYWFENVWSLPTAIELGNVLTTITREIEIYNAYRNASRSFTAATNNAGDGVSFLGLPSFPTSISPQHSASIFSVQITTSGPPEIDGTLDFAIDTGDVIITITGTRVVMFAYQPEEPIRERLVWATNIIKSISGKEQRISLRKNPRQELQYSYRVQDPDIKRNMQVLLIGFQAGVFGIPIWFEAKRLTADISATDTTIYFDTSYADFREGSLLILWKDEFTYEAIEIDTVNPSNVVLSSGTSLDYSIEDTLVMPLRVAYADPRVRGNRAPVNSEDVSIRFTVIDNDNDLADASAFPTHNSKVLFSEPNFMISGSLRNDIFKDIQRIDNVSAPLYQYSDWASSELLTVKGFLGYGLQRIWEVRQLAHALRGSHVTFYLPTFSADLVVVNNLTASSDILDIENIGYSSLINGQEPFKSVMILLNDGTVITRQVVAAEEVDSTTERLTVDVVWADTITTAEISKISFLVLSRMADDVLTIDHQYGGLAFISMGAVGVQQ